MTEREAAETFVKMLTTVAYERAISSVVSLLEYGPPGGEPPQRLAGLHQWFVQLDNQDRENVRATIRTIALQAVFGCCCLLDGIAGGYPVQGQAFEFALYLETYQDATTERDNQAPLSLRVNSPEKVGDDLHHLFLVELENRG